MAYKILIRHKSIKNKTYWEDHAVEQPEGTPVDFETDSLIELEQEINKIDQKYGYENIRVVSDIPYDVFADVADSVDLENATIATPEDVNDVFDIAYKNVFGGV